MHLYQTSIHIRYSNIQPSVLSVALATDQKSSNGCYNCTGQAVLYQPVVKMVTNICSMQIPYSERFFCVDTLHSISILAIHPADIFPHVDSKKVCLMIKHSVRKFSVISTVQYTAFIISFCEGMFSKSRNFYENNMIF